MKVARPTAKQAAARSATSRMDARGFSPMDNCMDALTEERDAPEDKEELKALLWTGWERSEATGKLRPSLKIRLDYNLKLLEYQYARMKATDDGGEVNQGVTVVIKNYTAPVVEVKQ